MANVYLSGIAAFELQTIGWVASDVRMLLVTAAYAFDEAHDFVSSVVAGELANPGYARQAILARAIVEDLANHRNTQTSANVVFPALGAGLTPNAAIIYLFNALDAAAQLICYNPLIAALAPNGGNYTINCPALGWFTSSN